MTTCPACAAPVLEGKKFCAECGAPQPPKGPPKCVSCAVELTPGAKFCPECGASQQQQQQQQPAASAPKQEEAPSTPAPESPAPPVVTTPKAAVEETTTSSSANEPSSPAPVPTTTAEATTPATPRDEPSGSASHVSYREVAHSTDSVSSSASSATKKKPQFQVKESPKCTACGKPVYKMDEVTDGKNNIFHKDCLKCKTCKCSLVGRERIMEDIHKVPIRSAQYLVARVGTDLGNAGDFFCEKHAVKAGADVVKAQSIAEKSRNDDELKRVSSMRKDDNERARESLKVRVGDVAICSRCGHPLDKGQEVVAAGMEKYHAACPTKEEAERAIRSVRFFTKRTNDRLVLTLTCDKETKHPHTFLYEMDKDSLTESLKKKANEASELLYVPDAMATRAGPGQRKLVVPSSREKREFDINIKDNRTEFQFVDFKNKRKPLVPKLDEATQDLVIEKQYLSNGVLQRVVARFKYDEASKLLAPENVVFSYEMFGEAAEVMEKELNPLADLKRQMEEVVVAPPSEEGNNKTQSPTSTTTAGSKEKKKGGGGCAVM